MEDRLTLQLALEQGSAALDAALAQLDAAKGSVVRGGTAAGGGAGAVTDGGSVLPTPPCATGGGAVAQGVAPPAATAPATALMDDLFGADSDSDSD